MCERFFSKRILFLLVDAANCSAPTRKDNIKDINKVGNPSWSHHIITDDVTKFTIHSSVSWQLNLSKIK